MGYRKSAFDIAQDLLKRTKKIKKSPLKKDRPYQYRPVVNKSMGCDEFGCTREYCGGNH